MGEEQVLGVTKVSQRAAGQAGACAARASAYHAGRSRVSDHEFVLDGAAGRFARRSFLPVAEAAHLASIVPAPTQQTMELVITNPMGIGVKDLVDDIVGHGAERHIPIVATVGIFILFSNMISLVPGFASPTATITVPLGLAVIVFLYYNAIGIGKHGGLHYAKTLLGPMPKLFPINIIMLVVETVSHFARLLSLSVRLWANMMVSELLYVSFLALSLSVFRIRKPSESRGIRHRCRADRDSADTGSAARFRGFLAGVYLLAFWPIVYLGLASAEEH